MRTALATTVLVIGVSALSACAKQSEPHPKPNREPVPTVDPVAPSIAHDIERLLPSAQHVAESADTLKLTSDERAKMVTAIERTQRKIASLDGALQARTQHLAEELGKQPFDKDLATSLGSEVIAYEAEIKQHHLSLMLELRALLTRDQLQQLGVPLVPPP